MDKLERPFLPPLPFRGGCKTFFLLGLFNLEVIILAGFYGVLFIEVVKLLLEEAIFIFPAFIGKVGSLSLAAAEDLSDGGGFVILSKDQVERFLTLAALKSSRCLCQHHLTLLLGDVGLLQTEAKHN